MQFGIFTVGDVTTDPTTGRTPTEHERVKAMTALALKAEEVGLDVFATGEHHNPPFVPSSPTTMLGWIAARTERLILSTATTLITTNDPVKIAEDFAMLQHLADGVLAVLAHERLPAEADDGLLGRAVAVELEPPAVQPDHPPGVGDRPEDVVGEEAVAVVGRLLGDLR